MSRLSKGLLVLQVAVSFLLLVGAGLFVRTLYNLQRVDLGFNQENLLVFRLQPEDSGYKDDRLLRFYDQLFARLDQLSGVRAATFGRVELIANDNWFNDFLLPDETEQTAAGRDTMRQMVRENYFATMEIPFLSGREFTAHDDQRAPTVAIVNQTFVRDFFPIRRARQTNQVSDNKRKWWKSSGWWLTLNTRVSERGKPLGLHFL